jgi:hypothetical protein
MLGLLSCPTVHQAGRVLQESQLLSQAWRLKLSQQHCLQEQLQCEDLQQKQKHQHKHKHKHKQQMLLLRVAALREARLW